MNKSVKIALGAIAAFFCLICLCLAVVVYFALSFYQGHRLFDEAAAAMSRREYQSAISTFNDALGKHLDKSYRAYALGDLAFCESADGHCDAAIRHYTEALRVDPKLAWAYENRGWLYNESAETDRALQDFSEAIRLDPNRYYAHFTRGLIEMDRKELDDAIEDSPRRHELSRGPPAPITIGRSFIHGRKITTKRWPIWTPRLS
jgi:tetratricopeptide (TPR) repeat protein